MGHRLGPWHYGRISKCNAACTPSKPNYDSTAQQTKPAPINEAANAGEVSQGSPEAAKLGPVQRRQVRPLHKPFAANQAPNALIPSLNQPTAAVVGLPQAEVKPLTLSAAEIEAFADSLIPALMQRDHVLGVSLAVVHGQTPLLIKGYGYDRLNPARRVDPTQSLFRLGSVTKSFVWIVARQEIEAGRLDPKRPIATYLNGDFYKDKKGYRPVTANDLFSHTAGFEETALGHGFQLDPARLESVETYYLRHSPRRVRDAVKASSYSNYGASLMAQTLTKLTQAKDIETLLEARLFKPLGMTSTSLREPYNPTTITTPDLAGPLPKDLSHRLSSGFIWDGAAYQPQPFDHVQPMSAALGASSTATDMARFMSMMLANGQFEGQQFYNAQSAKPFVRLFLKSHRAIMDGQVGL